MKEIIKVGRIEVIKETFTRVFDGKPGVGYFVNGQFYATLATAKCEAQRLASIKNMQEKSKRGSKS